MFALVPVSVILYRQYYSARITALLALGICGYLLAPLLYGKSDFFYLVLLFAEAIPLLFLLFTQALFEVLSRALWVGSRLVMATMLAYSLYLLLRHWREDLVERRRLMRLTVVLIVCGYILGVVVVESILGPDAVPHWVEVANSAGIVVSSLIFVSVMVLLGPEQLMRVPVQESESERLPAPDQREVDKIVEAMACATCLPLVLVLLDAYFYWAHRLMHHRALFRRFHLVHHKSHTPTPWAAYAYAPAAAIEGEWVLADGSAVVRVQSAENSGHYEGRVVALLRPSFSPVDGYGKPGNVRLDFKNPDRNIRDRPVLGMKITQELEFDGQTWNGKIYDPGTGNSYRCRITAAGDGYVEVRGSVGFSLLGRRMYWQRLSSFQRQMSDMLNYQPRAATALAQ